MNITFINTESGDEVTLDVEPGTLIEIEITGNGAAEHLARGRWGFTPVGSEDGESLAFGFGEWYSDLIGPDEDFPVQHFGYDVEVAVSLDANLNHICWTDSGMCANCGGLLIVGDDSLTIDTPKEGA